MHTKVKNLTKTVAQLYTLNGKCTYTAMVLYKVCSELLGSRVKFFKREMYKGVAHNAVTEKDVWVDVWGECTIFGLRDLVQLSSMFCVHLVSLTGEIMHINSNPVTFRLVPEISILLDGTNHASKQVFKAQVAVLGSYPGCQSPAAGSSVQQDHNMIHARGPNLTASSPALDMLNLIPSPILTVPFSYHKHADEINCDFLPLK